MVWLRQALAINPCDTAARRRLAGFDRVNVAVGLAAFTLEKQRDLPPAVAEEVLASLEEGAARGCDDPSLLDAPYFEPLRAEPRFQAALRRLRENARHR